MIYLDREHHEPLYEQIYRQYKEDILSGRIPGGTRLPATRQLALDLVVGRNTVENAYAQLLVEGYVSSRVGSGYTVNDLSLPTGGPARSVRRGSEPEAKSEGAEPRYDFRVIRMDGGAFPAADFKKYLIESLKTMNGGETFNYPPRQGDKKTREVIAAHLYATRGITCSPENIVITCGHQYSLDVICTILGTKPVRVAMEDPGYAGAHALFELRGAKMTPIPVERDGVDMEKVRASDANLLYLTPSHQYPTGAVLSIQKRLKAVEWAAKAGGYIIENDYDSDLRYNTRPIPSLYAMDKSDRVIYIGTLSRPISLELGIAYLVLPDALMKTYRTLYSLHYNSVPPLVQYAVAAYVESGDCAHHLDRFRVRCRKKHELMLAETARVFGDRVTVSAAGAGLYLLFTVHSTYDSDALIRLASEHGVRVYSLKKSWLESARAPKNQVLLGYGGIRQEDISPALALLEKAWFGGVQGDSDTDERI